jgi:hypothetical protein
MMDADGTRGDLPRKYRHGQSLLKKYKDKMVVDCTVLVKYLPSTHRLGVTGEEGFCFV